VVACTEAEKVEVEARTEDLVVESGDEVGNSGAATAPPSEAAALESLEFEPLNEEVAEAAASDPETRIISVAPAESTSSESGKVEGEEEEDGLGTIGLHQIEGKTLYLRC
jgi:hypothetical protein